MRAALVVNNDSASPTPIKPTKLLISNNAQNDKLQDLLIMKDHGVEALNSRKLRNFLIFFLGLMGLCLISDIWTLGCSY